MNIFNELKTNFKTGSIVIKLIFILSGIFLLYTLTRMFFSNYPHDLFNYLTLSANNNNLINKPWSLLTYSFLHTEFTHLISNIIMLYYFGKMFLYYFSKETFLNIYFLSALVGGLLFILIPTSNTEPLIGASAAIYGILIAITSYQPNKEISLFGIIRLKLWHLVALFILMDIVKISNSPIPPTGSIISHLGGGVMGYIYMQQFHAKDPLGRFLLPIHTFFNNRLEKPTFKTRKNTTTPPPPKDDYAYNAQKRENQIQVDTILDKISKSGYSSLSKEEKDFLFKQGK